MASSTRRRDEVGERLYGLALRAYPAAFRERFGEEMAQLFRDLREEARGAGPWERARFWARVVADVVASAPAQHGDRLTREWSREGVMRITFGVLLLLLAAGNIVYDGIHPKAHMGALAILLTAVAAAAGALLVRRQRKPT